MGALIAGLLAIAESVIPEMVKAGLDALPLVTGLRQSVDQLGTRVAPDDAEFQKLDSTVKSFEDDFDGAVAARLGASG